MTTDHITNRAQRIKHIILDKLKRDFGRTMENATDEEIFQAVALSVRDMILDRFVTADPEEKRSRRLYYLSAEYLMGRALVNNMISLQMLDDYKTVLNELGYPFERLEQEEVEAGLGNGGLGRLAACFLDSISTLELPVEGHGIRYEYGIFRQRIVNGEQVEEPDDWTQKGDVWEIERREEQVEVRFEGAIDEYWTENGLVVTHKNYQSVMAVPYDLPVIGYKSQTPAMLRLWRAESPAGFDLHSFNKGDYMCMIRQRELAETISKVLYPEDDHIAGRMLRLKQYYFLASAAMQAMVRDHKKRFKDIRALADYAVIQINDTHPALAIPELMRILMDEEALGWDEAYGIVSRVFNYTNHTVMREALEAWPEQLFKELLPRVYAIIVALNDRFSQKLWAAFPGDWDKISGMSIIGYDEIRMANMCIAVCQYVNGVSQLHGNILKTRTFRDFYVMFPEKFIAVTNGITLRRWLAVSNPKLTELIKDHIGEKFLSDYKELERLKPVAKKQRFLSDFAQIKAQNKQCFADYLFKKQGITINPDSIFDVQAKRLHEYKRQLLKVLHILHLYNRLTSDEAFKLPAPVTFLFAAKASPGYRRAKDIIRLINAAADLVRNHPRTKNTIQIVFLENYNVSLAELLIPAADISEQISTAGLEASGTGNMKFMLNGAVTLGTMDGANIEILEQVGAENIFIFGALAAEIAKMETAHSYAPKALFEANQHIREAVSRLTDGSLPVNDPHRFDGIYNALLYGDYDRADKYFVLHDFDAYNTAYGNVLTAYTDKNGWAAKAAMNTACAGFFSADRAVDEYNRLIWRLHK